MSEKSEKSLEKSTLWEKIVYGMGNVGANLCWTFMIIYVTMYYTDSALVPAAAVGTVMLVARLLDGVSDVIGAVMIEKVRLPLGKIRPWFLIAGPLLGVSLWSCFHVPASLDATGKSVYVFVTYTFTAAVSYTIYNLAYSSILPLMSMDSADRNKAAVIGNILTNGGMMIMNMATPVLLGMWGGMKEQAAWGRLVTIYSILCAVFIFCIGIFVKEKDAPDETKETEKESMGKLLKIVLSSKYAWILLVMFALFYLSAGIAGIRVYYFRDILNSFELYGVCTTAVSLVTMGVMALVPAVMAKLGKNRTVIIGMIIYCVSNLAIFVVGRNLVAFIVLSVIGMGIGMAPISAVLYTYLADLVDYVAKKHHVRVEGLVAMASSVGTKVGSGLGGAVVGWGLALVGYNALAEVQSEGTQMGIMIITAGIPLVMGALILLCLKMWDVGKEN